MTDPVLKEIGQLDPTADSPDDPNGSFHLILSTPSKDRDGDELAPDEWQQPLPDHITFDADHGMSVSSTIGSGKPYIDDQGRLMVEGTYASIPRAQEVRALVNEGHIRTASVAFLPHTKTAKDGKKTVTRELLNGAFVAIPANPEALVLSSKSGARNSKSDMAHIQAIHDHTADLGAACATKAVSGASVKDADDDPAKLVSAIDSSLDAAVAVLGDMDTTTLPPEVQEFINLSFAAGEAVDELLEVLGLPDPDEDSEPQDNADETGKSAAAAEAAARKAAAEAAAADENVEMAIRASAASAAAALAAL